MATINPERLLADLDHLRTFGATDNGVVRPSLSEVDLRSRHWLLKRMRSIGLDARIDGVGNVIGAAVSNETSGTELIDPRALALTQ